MMSLQLYRRVVITASIVIAISWGLALLAAAF